MNTFQLQDFQKIGQANTESAVKIMADWTKNWQAVTSEFANYSRRAFQDGAATLEQLMSAKSVEQAVAIQTSYAKRSYEDYMQQMTKIGSMYSSLSREAYKPVERAMHSAQSIR